MEVIKFVDAFTFKHCYPERNHGWTSHTYRVLDEGIELVWGMGDVGTCRWNGPNESSSSFSELCLGKMHQWEMENYFETDDTGSTGSDD